MHRMKFLAPLILALMGSLSACTRPDSMDEGKRGDTQASFVIKSAGGDGEIPSVDKSSAWGIPLGAHYSFWVCLEDRSSGNAILSQRFFIEDPETKSHIESDVLTDNKGCLKWKEEIPFNYFAKKSARIPVTRNIGGLGIHSGVREVHLAINPWALGKGSRDKDDKVIFLRDTILPTKQLVSRSESLSALSGDLSGAAELWVSQINVRTIKRKDAETGDALDMTVSLKPKVKVWDMNGEMEYRELNSGSFDVIMHLVAVNAGPRQDEKVVLTPNGTTGTGSIRDGELTVSLRTLLERRLPGANLELAIKLIPRGLRNQSLKEFEGIFEVGRIGDLSGSALLTEACREATGACQIGSYLQSAANFESLKRSGYAYSNDPFIFGNLSLRYTSVLPGETATQRVIAYTASTCITERLTGSRVIDRPFVIEYLDNDDKVIPGQIFHMPTNEEGCLKWGAEISHKYYQPEEFIWKRVRIRTESGASRTLKFALNPWDDKFTFGWDEREFSEKFLQDVQSRKKIRSRFFLDSFSYHTVRFLYEIDRFMELEVKKTVLLELQPRVLRYSGIVHARRQTEPLRDGVYLLKVGIQKSYLDPAERGVVIRNRNQGEPSDTENLNQATKQEFVTTKTALVRVVDGVLIQPIELTMRDLRLMRIRSNFMIQLETVDERLVASHQVLGDIFKKEIEQLKESRKEMSELAPEERDKKVHDRAISTKQNLESAFYFIREQLQTQNSIISDFKLDESLVKPIKEALYMNDFTELSLPGEEEMDLNLFVEKDSGLERRSFVGPVIFLSNGYSDSVRATDNLDEAKCEEFRGKDPSLAVLATPDAGLKAEEMRLFREHEQEASKKRQNNAYRFSQYYGALSHLCYKNVDDLIEQEKESRKRYDEWMPKVALLGNFVDMYHLDFISLRNEKLMSLKDSCEARDQECLQPVRNQLSAEWPVQALNKDFNKYVNMAVRSGVDRRTRYTLRKEPWRQDEIDSLVFGPANMDQQLGMCRLLSAISAHRLGQVDKDRRYAGLLKSVHKLTPAVSYMEKQLYQACLDRTYKAPPVFIDERYRVFETGDYVFRGGLQLNLNVGDSFSVGRSHGWGGSAGLDLVDVAAIGGVGGALIGGPVGAIAGAAAGAAVAKGVTAAMKPLKLSGSVSKSLSESEGTSVSQSTYLVSQIAKFAVDIRKFERCRIFRFDTKVIDTAMNRLGLAEEMRPVFYRGLMICQGVENDKPKTVEEAFFYFTQHFTEGDMLDQADIYNHPWLLSLRGVREYGVFVDTVKAQEEVSFGSFLGGMEGRQVTNLGWPLKQLANTYRRILPSFPGLYTVLDHDELITDYPQGSKREAQETSPSPGALDPKIFTSGALLSMQDKDINGEVKCTLQPDGTCLEKSAARQK